MKVFDGSFTDFNVINPKASPHNFLGAQTLVTFSLAECIKYQKWFFRMNVLNLKASLVIFFGAQTLAATEKNGFDWRIRGRSVPVHESSTDSIRWDVTTFSSNSDKKTKALAASLDADDPKLPKIMIGCSMKDFQVIPLNIPNLTIKVSSSKHFITVYHWTGLILFFGCGGSGSRGSFRHCSGDGVKIFM